MLPRRGWVGWIEEHSKVLGALSVWVFVTLGGIGALVASASGNHGAPVALPGVSSSSSAPAPITSGSGPATSKGSKVGGGRSKGGNGPSSTGPGGTGPGSTGPGVTQ